MSFSIELFASMPLVLLIIALCGGYHIYRMEACIRMAQEKERLYQNMMKSIPTIKFHSFAADEAIR